jgi:hypothetical protein
MKYRITNERTWETITVSGATIRECQIKAAKKSDKKGWKSEDIYRSEPVENIFQKLLRRKNDRTA